MTFQITDKSVVFRELVQSYNKTNIKAPYNWAFCEEKLLVIGGYPHKDPAKRQAIQ